MNKNFSSSDSSEDVTTPQRRGRAFEKIFASLLKKSGFSVKTNLTPKKYPTLSKELDILAISPENVVLFVECKTGSNVDLQTTINDLKGQSEDFSAFLRENRMLTHSKQKIILVMPDMDVDDKRVSRARKRGIYVWDKKTVAYYNILVKQLEEYSRFQMYGDLDVSLGFSEIIRTPGIKIKIRGEGKTIYNFVLPAEVLLKHSYVARRGSGVESHYQRMLNVSRIKRIAKRYLLNRETGRVWFPGSIIVALDEEPYFTRYDTNTDTKYLSFGELQFKNKWGIFVVIDGQHRLYSYVHAIKKNPELKDAPVSIFAISNLSIPEQAEIFQDINTKQKRISSDLTWDLLSDLPIDKKEKPRDIARILSAKIAKELHNTGPLKGLLSVPSDQTSKKVFRFGGVCTDILRAKIVNKNLFVPPTNFKVENILYVTNNNKLIKKCVTEINTFLNIIQKKDEQFYKNYVLSSNGSLSLFIRLLGIFVTAASEKKIKNNNDRYKLYSTLLEGVMAFLKETYPGNLGIKRLKADLNSEGGRKRIMDEIIDYLHVVNREYKTFELYSGLQDEVELIERTLSKRVLQIIGVDNLPKGIIEKIEKRLNKKIPEDPEERLVFYSEGLDMGTLINGLLVNQKIITQETQKRIEREVLNKKISYDQFILNLKKIMAYRNELKHGRTQTVEVRRIRDAIQSIEDILLS